MALKVCFVHHLELVHLQELAVQHPHQQLQDFVIAQIASFMTTEVEGLMRVVTERGLTYCFAEVVVLCF